MSSIRRFAVTGLMLTLTHLADRGERMTVDQIRRYIQEGSLFDVLEQCLVEQSSLAGHVSRDLDDTEKADLLDALGRIDNAVTAEDVGISNQEHGILFLAGLLIQVVQSGVDRISLD